MADVVTNELLLEHLKKIQATLSRHTDDLREIKEGVGILETHVGGLTVQYASLSNRLDRMDDRLARVERRLDLVEG